MIILLAVGAPPLLKRKPEIIEHGLIGIKTSPIVIRPQYGDLLRREIQDLSKLHFALPDLLFRLLSFGNICRATHELHQIPGCVQNRMADRVDVFDSAARKKDSEFQFVIRLFTYGSIDCPLPLGSILRMNALQPFFPSRYALFWIEAIYAIPFLGYMQSVSSRYPPSPTPCVREPLRFRQVRLASLQLLFLQFQGLDSESPIHPGRHQSQPEDDKGDGGNSGGAKC